MLSTLVDDWDLLSGDERKALVGEIFEEIDGQRVGDRGLPFRAKPGSPHVRAVVPAEEAERHLVSGRRDSNP
jgi:hypothetical protein